MIENAEKDMIKRLLYHLKTRNSQKISGLRDAKRKVALKFICMEKAVIELKLG